MTTTYELLREGEWTEDGRYLQPGSVTWPSGPITVMNEFGHPVGILSNVRREGSQILGDISIELPDDKRPTAALGRLDLVDREDQRMEFAAAELYGVQVSDADKYPWKE